MTRTAIPEDARPCVWMDAGLLAYKLCDRGFDCDRCPLDAALRGAPLGRLRHDIDATPRSTPVFPPGCRYSTGHTWVQGNGTAAVRFGLDALAAAVLEPPCEVTWVTSDRCRQRGETVCELDLAFGTLPLKAPFATRLVSANEALREDPKLVVTAPYEEGWILHLDPIDSGAPDALLEAAAAGDQARLDLRRFRRRIAMHLLADASGVGPTLPDGGEPLTDLCSILGGVRYLELLRELIH